MRILVCGGRNYNDSKRVFEFLDKFHLENNISVVIQGGAKGVDTLAALWALDKGIEALCFPANWAKFGKAAGHFRNKQMLDEAKPDKILAFPGGKGTQNMISQAKLAQVPVIIIEN